MKLAGRAPALAALLVLAAAPARAWLDRPFTLVRPEPRVLELDRENRIEGGPLAFDSPIADLPLQPLRPARLSWTAGGGEESIDVVPMAGEEFRVAAGDAVGATEAGALFSGRKGIASFDVDARMFFEKGGAGDRSFDREGQDSQNEATTGSVSYASYARYRGEFALDTRLGKLAVARDAAHWGPALFNNLVFQQEAVPFDQIVYHAGIGPVRVTSLYGELIAGSSAAFSEANLKGKNLYAHRYELGLGENCLLGLSEQLLMYGQNRPYLFTPVFPLFIAKGFMYEEANNGNIAMDLSYRFRGRALVYGEFLLDDMESPSSLLLRQYSQNKWGLVTGTHLIFDTRAGTVGAVAEYARLEPWVYTHFTPNTAQASNLGYPLGNPHGPNSETLLFKLYLRPRRGAYLGLTQTLVWKGRDPGSGLNDPSPRESTTPKSFLAGSVSPDYLLEPEAAWDWNGFAATCSGTLGAKASLRLGLRYFL